MHDLERIKHIDSLISDGKLDEGYTLALQELNRNPHNVGALIAAADCNMKSKRHGLAYHLYKAANTYKEIPQALNSMGYCLQHECHLDEAEKLFEYLVTGWPDTQMFRVNLATVYAQQGRADEALEQIEKVLSVDPDNTDAKWNGSLAKLAKRDWATGWDWYESALGTDLRPLHYERFPAWEGEGGTVLIYGEQGLGDIVSFADCIPDAIEKADKVILDVPERLQGLFQRSFPKAEVVSSGAGDLALESEPTHRLAIGSLGKFFRKTTGDYTGKAYLTPDPLRVVQWKALFDALGDKPKVGIMWRGGIEATGEERRSMDLISMVRGLNIDAEFISLSHRSYAQAECDACEAETGVKVHHFDRGSATNDVDDFAAMISQLDCVVSVTTSAIHIAGALGVHAHVLVPDRPQWRYGRTGSKMPFYDSVRLYRMDNETWDKPLSQIAQRLSRLNIANSKKTSTLPAQITA